MAKLAEKKINRDIQILRLKEQLKASRRFNAISAVSKVTCETIRMARIVGPFYFIAQAIRHFPKHKLEADLRGSLVAESETLSDALVSVFTDNLLVGIFGILGICGVLYGKYQEKLRRDDVALLSKYKEEHERSKDPKRSSSRLTHRGETRLEDE